MKKGLAALAAACFLFAGVGKAQAVVGIPDDVPGATLLFPFFKVNPDRTASSTLDTLLVVTNASSFNGISVHFTIWTVESIHAYDFTVTLTKHDVFACTLYDILVSDEGCAAEGVAPAPPAAAAHLETTINGRTLLAGYVTADLVSADPQNLDPEEDNDVYPFRYWNILIGHEYVVDLPAGSAGGFNAVSIEAVDPDAGHPTGLNHLGVNDGFYVDDGALGGDGDFLERIDGNTGVLVQTGDTADGDGDDDDTYDLIVRYFTSEALDIQTELWVWKETDVDSYDPVLVVYDEEENSHSITQPFPDEVNFVNVVDIITPHVPGGWFRIPMPEDEQSVAHSVQLAQSDDATLRWDAIFPAHRQYTDYLGGDGNE
jgi:hypothetical protein